MSEKNLLLAVVAVSALITVFIESAARSNLDSEGVKTLRTTNRSAQPRLYIVAGAVIVLSIFGRFLGPAKPMKLAMMSIIAVMGACFITALERNLGTKSLPSAYLKLHRLSLIPIGIAAVVAFVLCARHIMVS